MMYTTYGSVRGGCGHRHQSLKAAQDCLAKDQAGCKSQGGYSDRAVMLVGDDGYLYHDMGQVGAADGDHWVRGPGGSGVKV